jgi:uncharacterized protein (DUF4415 family)
VNRRSSKQRSRIGRQRVEIHARNSSTAALNDTFFKGVQLQLPQPKETITMRVDKDVLVWLKKQGPGYQTKINQLLRQYMDALSGA